MILRTCAVVLSLLSWSATAAETFTPTYDRAAFQKLMLEKSEHMQKIHTAVVSGDFTEIDARLAALKTVAESATWKMIRTDGYHERSGAFQTAIADMAAVSKTRDASKIIEPYVRLTTACVACHNDVRARLAK